MSSELQSTDYSLRTITSAIQDRDDVKKVIWYRSTSWKGFLIHQPLGRTR
jgi:hypothetical protein